MKNMIGCGRRMGAFLAVVCCAASLGTGPPAGAQIQSFLEERDPFTWSGIAGFTMLGAERTTMKVQGATIAENVFGEVSWDVKGFLGRGRNMEAEAPSFLVKFAPLRHVSSEGFGSVVSFSLGTRALSGVDLYMGAGAFLGDGRGGLGLGLQVEWDQMEGGHLSSPDSRMVLRTFAKLTPALGVDVATTFYERKERLVSNAGVVYELFPRFHVYLAFQDAFGRQVERRVGLAYAIRV